MVLLGGFQLWKLVRKACASQALLPAAIACAGGGEAGALAGKSPVLLHDNNEVPDPTTPLWHCFFHSILRKVCIRKARVATDGKSKNFPTLLHRHPKLSFQNFKTDNMKNRILSIAGVLALAILFTVAIVGCTKEDIKNTQNPTSEINSNIVNDTIDFEAYYHEVERMADQFWAACGTAYQVNPGLFMEACSSNNFEAFKQQTGLDQAFFERFSNALVTAQQNIERDHPGAVERYSESPCSECADMALQRIGKVTKQRQENPAYKGNFYRRDCWFVCSLGCMATLELYVPCVLGCVELCLYFTD